MVEPVFGHLPIGIYSKLRIRRGEIYPTTVKNRELIDVFGGRGETPAEIVPAAKCSYD
jgi:hypothetical protein